MGAKAPKAPRPPLRFIKSEPANYSKAVFAEPDRLPFFKNGLYSVLNTRYGVSFLKKAFLARVTVERYLSDYGNLTLSVEYLQCLERLGRVLKPTCEVSPKRLKNDFKSFLNRLGYLLRIAL